MTAWADYQEQTAEFFRSLGLEAATDVTVQGVRTSHDIDVVVRSNHVGFDLLWLIECKHWKDSISKLHVLALREIVSDIGADRGILMSESGYQRGAKEAAQLTNVQLTSLAELTATAASPLAIARLRLIEERIFRCSERYWSIEKEVRIDYGLRPDVASYGYSGARVINTVKTGLVYALRGDLPADIRDSADYAEITFTDPGLQSVSTLTQFAQRLELLTADLERRLDAVYSQIDPAGLREQRER